MPISLEHVSFTYMKGTPFEKTALHDVNLQIEKVNLLPLSGIPAAANPHWCSI